MVPNEQAKPAESDKPLAGAEPQKVAQAAPQQAPALTGDQKK